jgi:hypothetical protein
MFGVWVNYSVERGPFFITFSKKSTKASKAKPTRGWLNATNLQFAVALWEIL